MQKVWNFRPIDAAKQKAFSAELGISPVLAQILLNRGITDKEESRRYLDARLEDCYDSFLLKGMQKAVARIKKAIAKSEQIVVYGDYDVDGLTSCALLYEVLSKLGGNVSCYIPHRLEEGYGLNKKACQFIKEKGAKLLITVDCGISSFAEIKYFNAVGVDCIITDHHQPLNDEVPEAFCVINPLQKDCAYPYKELAGVGLAYKLAQAVSSGRLDVSEHLDFVALGTISDVAPLRGENRILVKHGLEVLGKTKKFGIKALLEVAGINKKVLSSHHIGYILGPRINAAGRIGSAEKSLKLLLSKQNEEAYCLAQALDGENRQRQRIEERILKEALAMVESQINFKYHRTVVLHNDDWHPGVIGIVASRIAEKFYRPTILFSTAEKIAKGSGRSIKNFHLFEALSKCAHLLKEYGGHENAVGVSILQENLDDFKRVFNEVAHKTLTAEDLVPVIDIDMDIDLGLLSEKLIMELEKCAPFGIGNPRPVFASRNLKLKTKPRLVGKNSFKLWVTNDKITCEAIGSRFYDLDVSTLQNGFSIVYAPAINSWHGISTIQLQLKDIQSF